MCALSIRLLTGVTQVAVVCTVGTALTAAKFWLDISHAKQEDRPKAEKALLKKKFVVAQLALCISAGVAFIGLYRLLRHTQDELELKIETCKATEALKTTEALQAAEALEACRQQLALKVPGGVREPEVEKLTSRLVDLRTAIETIAKARSTESWVIVENDSAQPVHVTGANPNGIYAGSYGPTADMVLGPDHIAVVSGGKASYGLAEGVKVSCDDVLLPKTQTHGKYLRVSEIKQTLPQLPAAN